MGESVAEFMERRRREIAGFGRAAETAAHEAYGKAISAGQDLRLGTPSEVMAYGAKLLQPKQDRSSPPAPRDAGSAEASSHQMVPREAAQLRDAALHADTAIRSAANVLTFGGADHLAAGMDALIQPGGLAGWDRRYQANLTQEHARNRDDKINRPVAQATGQVGGALLGLGAIGPMEGALAAAPRLKGAAALTGREAASILTAGGATGLGMQMLSDGISGRRSSFGDSLGATVGGVAGAAALPLGPARAAAVGASATSAAQDMFGGRPISVEHAAESAVVGNLLGGVAGVVGRGEANALPRRAKGRLGEALGDIRSTINGQSRDTVPKARDKIYEGEPYWYPDGRSGAVRFEDKFGVSANLSPNQRLAQTVLGPNFRLYHFLPADIGKAAGVPAATLAPHVMTAERRQ